MGIKDYAIFSTGDKIDNPKFLDNSLQKLKVLSNRLSRKQKGSKNRNKARIKLAKLHEKIKNQRNDFLHKLSHKIISENQTVILEDLSVKSLIEDSYKNIARNIADCSWYAFRQFLEYKADWYGKNVVLIGRFEASSKTCSNCGYVNNELTLKNRIWICNECKTEHDRDINAAINIKKFGLVRTRLGRPVEPIEKSGCINRFKEIGSSCL